MEDRELYRQLLGLQMPWGVSEIEVDFEEMKVDLWATWPPQERVICPECGQAQTVYDYREERKWRHLDTMQFQTILHCRIPRVECPTHGIKSIAVPWAEKGSRFTALFERLAIDVLLGCQNQTKAQALLRLSWDEVHSIQERAVQRGLKRREESGLKQIGVDEKSFLKGQKYVTVVCDLENPRVLDVANERKEESLTALLNRMPPAQRAGIEAVALDMWKPYMNVVESLLPQADMVHDKFHIAKYLGEAVDKVRRSEHKALQELGDETLTGTKYLWLTRPANWTEAQKGLFRQLKGERLKVGRAWAMKEMFSDLWEYRHEPSARHFFTKWYGWATHSRLKPMVVVAKMIKRHLDNILTYLKHRITNAVAEGLNSKIQQVKAVARGFRNFENYRTAILFFCGKLNLYPHHSQ